MARYGLHQTQGTTFSGAASQGVWKDVIDNLVPQITTYNGGNTVRVPPGAGKWEGHIVSRTDPNLRIDLQGLTNAIDKTTIRWLQGSAANAQDQQTVQYANWQVQLGSKGAKRAPFSAKSLVDVQGKKGSLAGVMMALGFDFTVDEFRTAMQNSYVECAKTGNFFCVLNPNAAYTDAVQPVPQQNVQQAPQEWMFSVDCGRGSKEAMTVYLGRMDAPFDQRDMVTVWLKNALPQTPCPHCNNKYALQLKGGVSFKSPKKEKGQ